MEPETSHNSSRGPPQADPGWPQQLQASKRVGVHSRCTGALPGPLAFTLLVQLSKASTCYHLPDGFSGNWDPLWLTHMAEWRCQGINFAQPQEQSSNNHWWEMLCKYPNLGGMFDHSPQSSPLAHRDNWCDDISGSFPSLSHQTPHPFSQLELRTASQNANVLYSNLYVKVFFGKIPEKAIIFHEQVFQLHTYLYTLVMCHIFCSLRTFAQPIPSA